MFYICIHIHIFWYLYEKHYLFLQEKKIFRAEMAVLNSNKKLLECGPARYAEVPTTLIIIMVYSCQILSQEMRSI